MGWHWKHISSLSICLVFNHGVVLFWAVKFVWSVLIPAFSTSPTAVVEFALSLCEWIKTCRVFEGQTRNTYQNFGRDINFSWSGKRDDFTLKCVCAQSRPAFLWWRLYHSALQTCLFLGNGPEAQSRVSGTLSANAFVLIALCFLVTWWRVYGLSGYSSI